MIFNARILIQQLTRSAYEMGGIKRKKNEDNFKKYN